MKKLMIAAAAVAMCCMTASAYQYRWKVGSTEVYTGNKTDVVANGTLAYIFNARDYSQSTLLTDLFVNKVGVAAITSHSFLDALEASDGDGTFNNYSGKKTDVVGKTYVLDDANYADSYFAIFSADGKSVFVSDAEAKLLEQSSGSATTSFSYKSGTVNDSQLSWTFDAASSFGDGGGWYSEAAPTPEPTSGLLLLLGVAGLALRRRRA